MNQIESYLNYIYSDFEKYMKSVDSLCELKNLSYKNTCIPDYRNIRLQQLYLLRYAYAYSYEYTEIYRQVLRRMGTQKEISVVSVGCGSMIDYWSLTQALTYANRWDCVVNYVGIDVVEWSYRFSNRAQDKIQSYLHNNAVECFSKNPKFVSDIYFFPKSISEFSVQEIKQIADCFEKKTIEKDKFFVCVSLRNSTENRNLDMEKTRILCKAIERNGFCAHGEEQKYYIYSNNKGIAAFDKSYHYPEEIIRSMSSLSEKCKNNYCKGSRCGSECCSSLNRRPILKTEQICYQIIPFERSVAV